MTRRKRELHQILTLAGREFDAVRWALGGALLMCAVAGLTGCQSTKDKSAELEAQGSTKLLSEEGLEIKRRNPDVRVTGTTILRGSEGTNAVVVDLRNDSGKNLTEVPILIEVTNAKGKPFYENDIPGIEPALAAVPYIPAHGDAEWVNDQVLGVGVPKSVRVTVGTGGGTYSGELPEIEVSRPKLAGDPVSGISATGDVVNKTGEDQRRLLLYVVARRGSEVVAAGRGAIEHLKPELKKLKYTIFFVGDPTGADLKLSEFPALTKAEQGGGGDG
ncbi:MAG TPA: hypothetical protein VG898_03855 [Solirubrobacterales bacterium]|nr:hypothetical protein [Solirubrobacterales bacterium]